MYKVYFKQAWKMLIQNKFISIISILGTALSIMMIMTIIVKMHIQNISLAPENNRDRLLYIPQLVKIDETTSSSRGSNMKHSIYRDWLKDMKTPEFVAVVNVMPGNFPLNVNRLGVNDMFQGTVRMTNDEYWKILSFSFVAGRPFDEAEYLSGVPVAVLSESAAKRLFHDENPLGNTVEVGALPFRVVGVVKDVSPIFEAAAGDVWVPFSVQDTYDRLPAVAILQARSQDDFPAIIEEVREIEKKFDIVNTPWELYLTGPQPRSIYTMEIDAQDSEQERQMIRSESRKTMLIIALLLLIPAINLTGFSLTQVKKRIAEIGIRKTFGAKRHTILFQILCENMLTSLIGGIVGLLFSYFMIFAFRHWLLGVPPESQIPAHAIVSFPILLAVFVLCVMINLLSAGLPAYRASRMNIVDSLNANS